MTPQRQHSSGDLIRTGRSDKYGQIYAERVGTPFDDPTEPVALLRAEDDLAYEAMIRYLWLIEHSECSEDQKASVRRQLERFKRFREYHPERMRVPGRRVNRDHSEAR